MLTERNEMGVPEVAAHSRQQLEGGVLIRYLQRGAGERDWRPVKLFHPTELEYLKQEAATDWYTDADPDDDDVCPACGEPRCTGTCILPATA